MQIWSTVLERVVEFVDERGLDTPWLELNLGFPLGG